MAFTPWVYAGSRELPRAPVGDMSGHVSGHLRPGGRYAGLQSPARLVGINQKMKRITNQTMAENKKKEGEAVDACRKTRSSSRASREDTEDMLGKIQHVRMLGARVNTWQRNTRCQTDASGFDGELCTGRLNEEPYTGRLNGKPRVIKCGKTGERGSLRRKDATHRCMRGPDRGNGYRR